MKNNNTPNLVYKSRKDYQTEIALALHFLNQIKKNIKASKAEKITFKPLFIGSKKTNEILVNLDDEQFDFDINLCLESKKVQEKEPQLIFGTIFRNINPQITFENTNYKIKKQKGSRGIIKIKFFRNNKLFFSLDLAITKVNNDGEIFILRQNIWEKTNQKLNGIKGKVKQIKNEGKWMQVRDEYRKLKINNYKKVTEWLPSYILYIQAVNNVLNHLHPGKPNSKKKK